MKLSIIVPVLNESESIAPFLHHLQPLRQMGCELIVVDGGSEDGTVKLAEPFAERLLQSKKGRAAQMNTGAGAASGDILLFLHADTSLPDAAFDQLKQISQSEKMFWGRFDLCLSGKGWSFRLIETMINLRSRLTGISTGDQAMFVSRTLFEKVGQFPELDLMEDIELSRRLKRISKPCCLKQRVITSSRRWEQKGVLKTVCTMWTLRLGYFFGADPARLKRIYYGR